MLIGLVTVFALLAVGFGYVVFAKTSAYPGVLWDVGFLASVAAFLTAFVALIWRHAERQVRRDPRPDEATDERET